MTQIERINFYTSLSAHTGVPLEELVNTIGEFFKKMLPLLDKNKSKNDVILAAVYLLHLGGFDDREDGDVTAEAHHLLDAAAGLLNEWESIIDLPTNS